MAAWLHPSKLSACTAISCFSSGWVVASNMDNEKDEALIRSSITARFNTLKAWCNDAIAKAGDNIKPLTKTERVQWIMNTIITNTAYRKGIGEAGFSFEIPPEHQMNPNEPIDNYGRENLAKVVDSLCFNTIDLTSLEKSFFFRADVYILLPIATEIKRLLGPSEYRKWKNMGPIRSKNYHAEQLLFLFGDADNMRLRGYLHMVGISKLCCADCFSIAVKRQYLVSGSHKGIYPGVVNLYDLTIRQDVGGNADQRRTATPVDARGYETPPEDAENLRSSVRQKDRSVARYQPFLFFRKPSVASLPSVGSLNDLSLSDALGASGRRSVSSTMASPGAVTTTPIKFGLSDDTLGASDRRSASSTMASPSTATMTPIRFGLSDTLGASDRRSASSAMASPSTATMTPIRFGPAPVNEE